MGISDNDRTWLRRAVDLAREALDAGDEPYGSVLVSASGEELFADRNRVSDGDRTRHPEFAIARWAAGNLTPGQRATSVVYTSGEHCAMCAAAHGWVGLGRIVYAASSAQIAGWSTTPSPITVLPVGDVIPGAVVDGPDDELAAVVEKLIRRSAATADH